MKTRPAPRPAVPASVPVALSAPAVLPPRTRTDLGWYVYLAGAMLLTMALYLPSLRNGITNWDDPDYLTNNPLLDFGHTPWRAYFTTVISGNLHPLTMLSLSLDHTLGGTSPQQVHATSLLLHVLNVGLVFLLIRQLSGGRQVVSFLAALWFGIHPMHVESVAWIAERKDVLYGFFFLLALITYQRFLATRSGLFLGLSLGCALLANLAKPAAVILPAVLVLLTVWHNKKLTVKRLLPIAPFLVLSAVFAWLTLQSQASAINDDFTLWERTQLAGYALVNYLLKAVWPVGLSALYGRPGAGTSLPVIFLIYTALSTLGLVGLAWLYRRSALWFFGVAFFGVNLLLTLQLIKAVGSAAYADRYTYIAYIGLFFALAMTADKLQKRTWRLATVVAAVVFTLACGWLTFQRTAVWKNSETLWTDVLKTQPFSATAHSNRALYYEQNDRLDDALADYSLAVQADPKPLFRANRAYLLSKLNRTAEAEADADFLLTQNPKDAVALTIKGTALISKNQPTDAITYLTRSYALDSTYLNTLVNLGSAYFVNKQYDEAAIYYRKAIRRDPKNGQFLTNLGATYLQNHQYADAVVTCEKAIAIDPANGPAHLYACYALQKTGRFAEANTRATQAKRLGQLVDDRVMTQ